MVVTTGLALSFMFLSACAWVKLTPNGEKVQILSSNEIVNCKKIGKTSVSLKAKIIGINRKKEKVKSELETLGRNHGSDMGGDTIVAASEIENGEQSFDVYQCLEPKK